MESDQDLGRLLLAKFTELWTSDPLVDEIGLMYTVRPTDGDKAATVRDDVGSSFVLEQHKFGVALWCLPYFYAAAVQGLQSLLKLLGPIEVALLQ